MTLEESVENEKSSPLRVYEAMFPFSLSLSLYLIISLPLFPTLFLSQDLPTVHPVSRPQ